MTRLLLLAVLASAAAHAQLTLLAVNGTTGTPVGAVYNYGNVPAGNTAEVRFRAQDIGASSILLTTLSVSGNSFSILGAPSLPYTIAPGNFLEFTVQLAPVSPGSFSGSLRVSSPTNSVNVTLLASAVAAPVLGGLPPCSPDSAVANQVDFASVQFGNTGGCNFSLQNPYAQSLVISSIAVTGSGFLLMNPPSLPATIAPGSATDFAIQITPACGTTFYSGALIIGSQGLTQTFPLAGTAFVPPLPKPAFSFTPSIFASGEQVTLAMSLPAPYPCPALVSGYVNLAFKPTTTLVTADPAIVFLPGSTLKLPFSLNANSAQMSIAGQPGAIFQTGTTAGVLTFSVTTTGVQLSADPTTIVTIPPALISIESVAASNQQTGALNIEVIGVDNTYTAGVMSFTFFDTTSKTIGSGTVNADFTSAFKTYFTSDQSGGAFLMNVSFPVTGNALDVGSVKVTLTNSAGETQTGSLTFQ
jgi:hypothetical protein